MEKIGKRGVSAVEMIISFLLFLGLITFIFVYMNPLGKSSTLMTNEAIAEGIEKYAGIEMNVTGISSEGSACFSVQNVFGQYPFVMDEDGNKVGSMMEGGNLYIEGGRKFYYVYSGDSPEHYNLSGCRDRNYSTSVMGAEKTYSYKKLAEMNTTYHSNYASLKSELKIPSSRDFTLTLFDDSMEKIVDMSGSIPKRQIVSLEYPVEILKDNEMIKGTMRILSY